MSGMDRYGFDDDGFDDEYETFDMDDELEEDELDQEDELSLPEMGYSTGETNVDISMEVDEDGNEVWFAGDSRIPGSSSMGHSLEEAMEGVEERRRQYREVLRKSREERARREREGE